MEPINFLHAAQGSLSELDTQLELSGALGYVDTAALAQLDDRMTRIDKMLTGLIKSLRQPLTP